MCFLITLKILGPHFPSNYWGNANWHEGFNGIFSSLFAFLRVPVDVYGSLVQNAGGKTGAKMLPCVSLANSGQLARCGSLRVKLPLVWTSSLS